MKLCVGSVFAADDAQSQKWLDLQLQFLKSTTQNFDHVAIVWGGNKTGYFTDKTHAIYPEGEVGSASVCHREGLNHITSFFREQNDYSHFLYLDCDAFPIKTGWLIELSNQMEEQPVMDNGMFSRMVGRDYDIAVIVRAENLETRLHASVLFVKKSALPNISFAYDSVGSDLRGNAENDIHIPEYQWELRDQAFALMRSNKKNLHPLACGVYYNMFYHHGCGSRVMKVRGNSTLFTAKPYWDSFGELKTDDLTEQLMESPSSFISELAGWTPSRYA